jgi:dTDP-glucose 4,6-dehydratase
MINIGSGDEISISDLVETIGRRMGREINVEEEERRLRPYASEVYRLCADNRKAKNILGWTSKIDLETGLSKTIEWFERNKDRYKQMNYHI